MAPMSRDSLVIYALSNWKTTPPPADLAPYISNGKFDLGDFLVANGFVTAAGKADLTNFVLDGNVNPSATLDDVILEGIDWQKGLLVNQVSMNGSEFNDVNIDGMIWDKITTPTNCSFNNLRYTSWTLSNTGFDSTNTFSNNQRMITPGSEIAVNFQNVLFAGTKFINFDQTSQYFTTVTYENCPMDKVSADLSHSYSFPNSGLPVPGKTLTLVGSYPGMKIQNFNGSIAFGPNTDLTDASFAYSRFLWQLKQDLSTVNLTDVNIFSTRVEYGQAGVTPGGYQEYQGRTLVNLCITLNLPEEIANSMNYRTAPSQSLLTAKIGTVFQAVPSSVAASKDEVVPVPGYAA